MSVAKHIKSNSADINRDITPHRPPSLQSKGFQVSSPNTKFTLIPYLFRTIRKTTLKHDHGLRGGSVNIYMYMYINGQGDKRGSACQPSYIEGSEVRSVAYCGLHLHTNVRVHEDIFHWLDFNKGVTPVRRWQTMVVRAYGPLSPDIFQWGWKKDHVYNNNTKKNLLLLYNERIREWLEKNVCCYYMMWFVANIL